MPWPSGLIAIEADDKTTLDVITTYGLLGTYLVAVFVLTASFSTNTNALLF